MTNTFYQPYDELPYTAQGYFDLYNNNSIVNVSNLITGSGNGYGGIFSNVFDLYKFIDALLVKQTVLSTKSLTCPIKCKRTIFTRDKFQGEIYGGDTTQIGRRYQGDQV